MLFSSRMSIWYVTLGEGSLVSNWMSIWAPRPCSLKFWRKYLLWLMRC